MAEPLPYTPRQRTETKGASEELHQLVDTLHEKGILRFSNDFLQALPEAAELLMRGLNKKSSQNAVQNLALFAMAFSSISPERYSLVVRSLTEALSHLEDSAGEDETRSAPGVSGLYKLLHDETLWQGLWPLISAIRGASGPLREEPDKPAAKRSGESGH